MYLCNAHVFWETNYRGDWRDREKQTHSPHLISLSDSSVPRIASWLLRMLANAEMLPYAKSRSSPWPPIITLPSSSLTRTIQVPDLQQPKQPHAKPTTWSWLPNHLLCTMATLHKKIKHLGMNVRCLSCCVEEKQNAFNMLKEELCTSRSFPSALSSLYLEKQTQCRTGARQ